VLVATDLDDLGDFLLPESYRFLIVKGGNNEKVRKILTRIAPTQVQGVTEFHVPEEKPMQVRKKVCLACCFLKICQRHGFIVADLFHGFGDDLSAHQLVTNFMRETGATMERAAFIGGLFQFGGVLSALFIGWAMDRFNPNRIIAGFYFVAGIFVL
jgi:AAHS family 4-hydroxybenzoate transporter-like MFS transporter